MTSKFGRFQVLPHRREVLTDGVPVAVGSRAFDVLMVLIEAGGELVTKDELLNRVWPGRVVEEHSLQFHISTLRKVFGKDRSFIKTISGRGYRFVADITAAAGEQEALLGRDTGLPPTLLDAESLTNLPAPTSELIGRELELCETSTLLTAHRLVTLVGAGGIGKTRLGLDVARRLRPDFADGVWVAELGPLSDPDLVPVTIANALGLKIAGGAVTPERVASALGAKQLLLVLDNCEHVIDAAASMAEAVLRASPAAHVMATSREPLRAVDECLYRVPPLAVPAEGTEEIDDLLSYGAVQLFVARVRATEPHFAPDQPIAPAIAAICRRLDGIALAIELAAARAAALGVGVVATHLDDRFRLLTGGRRTAHLRHQTLRATLDWSYELLAEAERVVLRRLSIFAGSFTLEAAGAIAAGAELAALDVINAVANLVAKSLVIVNAGDTTARYRMLETTRAYAVEKLTETSELEHIARRHAEYCLDLLEHAETELETKSTGECLAAYAPYIDNIRAALDWGFSPSGDASIGMAVTAASVPLWTHLSLMEECRGRVERALVSPTSGSSGPGSNRDLRCRMKLYAALGLSLIQTKGPACAGAAWTKALELARSLDDTEYQLRALWGLWMCGLGSGEYRTGLALARRFCSLAENHSDPLDLLVGDRMMGTTLHYLGDQTNARRHIEHMLARYVTPIHRSHIIRFQYDQQLTANCTLARILCVQGFPDQAMRIAQSIVEEASITDHALSLCDALVQAACPVALFIGDLAAAERFVAMLLDYSARHALAVRHAEGHCLRGTLFIQRGDFVIGSRYLRYALKELRKLGFVQRCPAFLGALAEGLGRAGQRVEGLVAIDEALALSENDEERWCVAELLRIKGELVLSEDEPAAAEAAEDHFGQALDWARRQGALSWELRAAASLARLWRDQNRTRAAREILAAVYDRFTEGFETADLKTAKLLLDGLRPLRRQQVGVATLAISLCAGFGGAAELLAGF
jgi:predicted ATPase/DNA-binding winged helix-turn-helix (wHTH) protein